MTLRKITKTLALFIQVNWSDERLAEVSAFNADDKMEYLNACACFLGVTSCVRLHRHCDSQFAHYLAAKDLPGAAQAEGAYFQLGYTFWQKLFYQPAADDINIRTRRKRMFADILAAEINRRDREREAIRLNQGQPVDYTATINEMRATGRVMGRY